MPTADTLMTTEAIALPNVVIVNGVPALVTDVLSPKDTFGDVHKRINGYLRAGVPLVWAIHQHDRTVTVHRPDARPQLFNDEQELTGEPHLPGFRVPVARLFG
jgi:Uma2 family endonuclease